MMATDTPTARVFDGLVGQSIVSITFVHDYCQIEVEDSSRLTLFAAPTFVSAEGAVKFSDGDFADKLRRQIGHRIVRVDYEGDDAVVFVLDHGAEIVLPLNEPSTGPERGTLRTPAGPIFVW